VRNVAWVHGGGRVRIAGVSNVTPPAPRLATSTPVDHDTTTSEWLIYIVPIVVLTAVAFAVAWYFVKPAPPTHVVIATGPKTGVYYAMAKKYVDYFKDNGVTLEVRETRGTVENYELLTKEDGGVDVAIVQAGASPPEENRPGIQAVAGIYYEPVLLFHRGESDLSRLTQLAGKRIAVGVDGSGVRVVAKLLLDEAGVGEGDATLLDVGGDAAADGLANGTIDAAFYVISPDAPVVARLLATPGVRLMSFDHSRAYGRRHPFLSPTTLFRGSVDVRRDLPAADVSLIAAPATIAVRGSTHQAIVQLLVRAAQETNRDATLLADAGTFPNVLNSELPVSGDARYFLANPPNILHRTLPFWVASLIDRLIILVLPLLVVLIPLIRLTPPLFKWRTQRKLLARYRRVRQIETEVSDTSPRLALQSGVDELRAMDQELARLKLPVAYAKDLFDLRNSIAYVTHRIEGWLQSTPRQAT
jgi:TRAP transporter TAXI family solute receptor